MPSASPPPKYRLHKPTGLAVVRLNGKDFYLGKHQTPESLAKYDRLVGEWLGAGRLLPAAEASADGSSFGITIAELIAAYWTHAEAYYRKPDGKVSSELSPLRYAAPDSQTNLRWVCRSGFWPYETQGRARKNDRGAVGQDQHQ